MLYFIYIKLRKKCINQLIRNHFGTICKRFIYLNQYEEPEARLRSQVCKSTKKKPTRFIYKCQICSNLDLRRLCTLRVTMLCKKCTRSNPLRSVHHTYLSSLVISIHFSFVQFLATWIDIYLFLLKGFIFFQCHLQAAFCVMNYLKFQTFQSLHKHSTNKQ